MMNADVGHTPETLGQLIRQARERAGLSLRNLEAITGVHRATLDRLELDKVDDPSVDTLLRLADALELNSDDLFILLGHQPSTDLPSLTPYLRSKYHLPPAALAEASQALHEIFAKYDRERQADTKDNQGKSRRMQ